MTAVNTPRRPNSSRIGSRIRWTAKVTRGVWELGFQMTVSPQTPAIMAFQLQTALGKLKAVTTPTGPRECHCSYRRCPGRSLWVVMPYSCLLSPRAKSAMSIISWTSPRASGRIFPISRVMSRARGSLYRRSCAPMRRTTSPRRGAGMADQVLNPSRAPSMIVARSPESACRTRAISSPSRGEIETRSAPWVFSHPSRPPRVAPEGTFANPTSARMESLIALAMVVVPIVRSSLLLPVRR